MIARLGRLPHYPSPGDNEGHWQYVEVDVPVESETHKEVMTLRGWVNPRGIGSAHFNTWLTDELFQKMRGMARVQKHARLREPSADYTSPLLSSLCSVLLPLALEPFR